MNKEFLKSALYTCVTAFIVTLSLQVDTLSMDSLTSSTLVGLLGVCLRAGIKALGQYLATKM